MRLHQQTGGYVSENAIRPRFRRTFLDGSGGGGGELKKAERHVIADAAVSVLAIIGLTLAKIFGWLWMDPLAGTIGALVIANWSYGLIRDTGAILLDMWGSGMESVDSKYPPHAKNRKVWRAPSGRKVVTDTRPTGGSS